MNKYLLLASLLAFLGIILPRRRQQVIPAEQLALETAELLSRIRTQRFNGVEEYVIPSEIRPGEHFWRESGGMRGVYDRWCEMGTFTHILQLHVKAGAITEEDAYDAFEEAKRQKWYSAWVPIECAFCSCWAWIPHTAALNALRSHYQLSLAIFTLCGTESASCMPDLSYLL